MILGISGKAGSGKFTAAAYLVEKYGFTEVTFAGPLKRGAECLFSFNPEQTGGFLKEVVDYRLGITPREAMQRLGDACRQIWPAVFIEPVLQRIFSIAGNVVISDLRFANEARALHLAGGVLARIVRPATDGTSCRSGHASETELDRWNPWDMVIANDGTLGQFYGYLDGIMQIWLSA